MLLQEFHDLLDEMPEEAYPELEGTMKDMKKYYLENRDIVIPERPKREIIETTIVKRSASVSFTIEEE